jgi:dnd system-associated protein 4
VSTDLRVRFDDTFDKLIDELRELPYFTDNSTIAVFAASLGFSSKARFKRRRGSRDVRVNVLLGYPGALELMNTLALLDAEVDSVAALNDATMQARAKILEEYTNGGLSVLKSLRAEGRLLALVIPDLINKNFK